MRPAPSAHQQPGPPHVKGVTMPPKRERTPDKKRCTATCSGGQRPDIAGKPCRNWAVHGADVCTMHGGRAHQVKAAAQQRKAEREITAALGRLQITPIHDPLTALAALAGEITAWKELAAERVATLKALAQRNYATGADEVHAEIQVYERDLDRTVTDLATIARM